MLPLAQMKIAVEQANMIVGQKQKQNEIFQREWRASGKPMDEKTYIVLRPGDTKLEGGKAILGAGSSTRRVWVFKQ